MGGKPVGLRVVPGDGSSSSKSSSPKHASPFRVVLAVIVNSYRTSFQI